MNKVLTILIIGCILTVAMCAAQESDPPELAQEMESRIQELSIQLKQRAADGDLSGISEALFQIDINSTLLDSIIQSFPLTGSLGLNMDSLMSGDAVRSFRRLLGDQAYAEREGIVKFGGDAVVGRNELVRGDIVVFGGDAVIYGRVQGGVVVVLGDVKLTSTSYVKDDVITIWGTTSIDQGARISGKTSVFNFGKVYKDTISTGILSRVFLLFRLLRMVFFFLIAYAVLKAFPEAAHTIQNTIESNWLKSLIVGFIGLLLIPALFIVLIATILGIPIAFLLMPLAVIAAFILGGTSISLLAGRMAGKKLGIENGSQAAYLAIGIGILELPSLLGRIVQFFSPFLTTVFFVLTLMIFIMIWLPGFGGVLITRFGRYGSEGKPVNAELKAGDD